MIYNLCKILFTIQYLHYYYSITYSITAAKNNDTHLLLAWLYPIYHFCGERGFVRGGLIKVQKHAYNKTVHFEQSNMQFPEVIHLFGGKGQMR